MGVSAGIVVTGTEVLTGRVADRNGPWLAEQLRLLGVDVGQIVVVGDRPDDLASALRFLAAHNDLVITSGGLGPTADDLTAEVVAQVQGRPPRLDPGLEQRITAIVARFGGLRDPESTAIAIRKQALVPEGASVLEPTGTAPGLVVPVAPGHTGPPVVVLPGPPSELQRMWPAVVATPVVRAVLAGAPELRQHTLRLWAVPESELAATLRRSDGDLAGLEITTCLRAGELEIVSRYAPEADPAQQRLVAAVRADFPTQLFSEGPSVEELIAAAIWDRAWTLSVVEAVTGGALAARLASARLVGAVVAHTDAVLIDPVGVPIEVVQTRGPADPQIARTMAEGARRIFGADVGIGVAGSVSLADAAADRERPSSVYLCVLTPDGEFTRTQKVTGPLGAVRARVVPVVLHLLREALTGS